MTGAEIVVAASPWRLGAAEADLAVERFNGWIRARVSRSPSWPPTPAVPTPAIASGGGPQACRHRRTRHLLVLP